MNDSNLPDSKGSQTVKGPVFVQPARVLGGSIRAPLYFLTDPLYSFPLEAS
jgi:hypothetical protein